MDNCSLESENKLNCIVMIKNVRGLHARAAAKFVKTASAFNALIQVSRDTQIVSGKSIMGLMMLAASPGTKIKIISTGIQAKEALEALKKLVESGFDEES